MDKIPEWQYPLYKEIDFVAYSILEKIGKSKEYPKIIGSKSEINDFIKLLVVSQKLKDYRRLRDIVLSRLGGEKLDVPMILSESRDIKIIEGVDESWAIFQQDKRICELIDNFYKSKIEFEGNDTEIIEFIIRFILSQLLQDWRGPLMAILLGFLSNKNIRVGELNNLLKIWDYTKIFKN